eukprot:m.789637 g.789637  ORF g.789637 m.789637 type:complete len:95 (-) comp59197_c0_seq5:460-744(-)
MLVQPVRLMTGLYRCDLVASTGSLGKVYAVLSRRNGKITNEEMKDRTDTFLIQALLPVTDSFGFSEELRKKTRSQQYHRSSCLVVLDAIVVLAS